jgi:hypothetical protein
MKIEEYEKGRKCEQNSAANILRDKEATKQGRGLDNDGRL